MHLVPSQNTVKLYSSPKMNRPPSDEKQAETDEIITSLSNTYCPLLATLLSPEQLSDVAFMSATLKHACLM